MKIQQVNYYDNLGGAARIAWLLHQGYQNRNHESWMVVGKKFSKDSLVYTIPESLPDSIISQLIHKLSKASDSQKLQLFNYPLSSYLNRLADPLRYLKRCNGKEDFNFPNSRKIIDLSPTIPEIVHFHNLHLNYFDLTFLPEISMKYPTVITLHDMWMLTGHCAYSTNCQRWKTGCGSCPHLDVYPAIQKDQSAFNWQRKKEIYEKTRIYLAGPSEWIVQTALESILAPAIIKSRVIPNGIDLTKFRPDEKQKAREILGLPKDAVIFLFVSASGIKHSSYKDFFTIEKAISIVAQKDFNKPLILVALGDCQSSKWIGNTEIRYIPQIESTKTMSHYYQAADIYLHASKADTFPTTLLEAQACGTPVIATSVGGIPTTFTNGECGFLTKPNDALDMTDKIILMLSTKNLIDSMGVKAASFAKKNFGVEQMVQNYLSFYQEILDDQKAIMSTTP